MYRPSPSRPADRFDPRQPVAGVADAGTKAALVVAAQFEFIIGAQRAAEFRHCGQAVAVDAVDVGYVLAEHRIGIAARPADRQAGCRTQRKAALDPFAPCFAAVRPARHAAKPTHYLDVGPVHQEQRDIDRNQPVGEIGFEFIFIVFHPVGIDRRRHVRDNDIRSAGTIAGRKAPVEHRVLVDVELRADRIGEHAFGRRARIIGLGNDGARTDLAERLLVPRPAQAPGDFELFAELEGAVAEDRIFLVGRGQTDDR